ncbi:hypothetical protein YPPY58_3270, partial [Yersinia pestis PY-58]
MVAGGSVLAIAIGIFTIGVLASLILYW